MKIINVALIGHGYWGSKLRRYVDESIGFDLRYICDSKSDLNQVWDDRSIDAVIVATPNEVRPSIVKEALYAGKNVLSEKPLAFTVEECEELKRDAERRGLLILVDYTWTFSKGLGSVRSMVSRGQIGNILGIEMSVKHLGRFGGGSVYWLLGSHMLSVLDMFVSIEDLSFSKTDLVTFDGNVETGIISFTKGLMSGQIVVSLNYTGKETKVVLYGEDGTIIYNPTVPFMSPTLILQTYKRLGWTLAPKLLVDRKECFFNEDDNLYYVIDYFYDMLVGKADSNINRAIAVTKVLEELRGRS